MKALILILMGSILLVGCPREKRALNGARKAVEIAAQTVDLVDSEVAILYTEAAVDAIVDCVDSECYSSKMRRWDKTVLAVVTMKTSLLLVENTLDVWEAGSPNGRNSLLGAAACFIESMVKLQTLLAGLDVKAPALDSGLNYTDELFGTGGIVCPIGVY